MNILDRRMKETYGSVSRKSKHTLKTISLSAALLESLEVRTRCGKPFDTQPVCLATIETWNHLIPSRTQP